MIDREKIEGIIRDKVAETGVFVVDIQVKAGNVIQVYLDEPEGISIDTCVAFSRLIESSLDRETEDFELQVSSPGLTEPLKVPQQYYKNTGQSVTVLCLDGAKYTGLLTFADESGIKLDAEVKVKTPESKKKKTEIQSVSIEYKDIKTTKVNLVF